jgi:hypothetical protein
MIVCAYHKLNIFSRPVQDFLQEAQYIFFSTHMYINDKKTISFLNDKAV